MDPKNPADQPSNPIAPVQPENPAPIHTHEIAPVEQTYYSRESGKKTLFLVVSIIALVTLLSVASLLMINKKSATLIRTNAQTTNETAVVSSTLTKPTLTLPTTVPIKGTEEEIDSIDFGSSDKDFEDLTDETKEL